MSTSRLDVGAVPQDAHARLIHLSNAFGRLYFDTARTPCMERAHQLLDSLRPDAEALVDRALYGAVQVLDGVTAPIGNDEFDLEFVLTARIRDRATGEVVDEVELGPNGEGLCMGFHGWIEGDFGAVPP